MAIPNKDCVFSLDGEEFKGVEAFLDHLIKKDVTLTPEEQKADERSAKDYGYKNVHEAIGSVNKRLGTDYTKLADIPADELKQASKQRKAEQFDSKVDNAANKIVAFLHSETGRSLGLSSSAEGAKKSGVSPDIDKLVKKAADLIKKAYHAGEDISEAVKDAIDYIKKNWDKTWGELDTDHIARELYDAGALTVDEEVERTLGLTPQEVLDVWNSVDAGRDNPELLKFIQGLSNNEKKAIVKDALKGIVSDKLKQFVQTIKEKTGKTIDFMQFKDLHDTIKDKIETEVKRQADLRANALKEIDEALKAATKSQSLATHIRNSRMIQGVKDVAKGIGLAFHPAMFEGGDLAREAMMVIRKEKGKEARENELADLASRKLMHDWNFIPKKEKIGFILSLENFEKFGEVLPEYKEIAKQYRDRMDAVFNELAKIKDLPYIEDYFPHFWEKPEKAQAHFSAAYSKAPFEGNKSFLKQRFYNDILEGLKAGLKLATDNPEEMVRLAEMNALKFTTAHDIFGEMKDRGLLKYFRNGSQPEGWKLVDDPLFKRMALFTVNSPEGKEAAMSMGGYYMPEGWKLVDDPLFKRMALFTVNSPEGKEAAMSMGGYYMPEPVARVVNNYLSRGISGSGMVGRNLYGAVREWNNIKNLFQLGIGAFHLTTTTVDATVTGVANSFNEMLRGHPQGLLDLAKSLTIIPNIAKNLIIGDKTIKAYRTAALNSDVQEMVDANGRTGLSKIYTLDSFYNLNKAIGRLTADKDFKAIPAIVKNALLFIPEITAKPLMEWYVPRLKVGGYMRTLELELNAKKGLTPDEITKLRQKTWDDMDDRLGQMVYDNIFWNKSMKDIAFMTIRSFGWTGGTIRAFGKGIGDIPGSAKSLVQGKGISPRSAWLLSLPATVGLYGAMYQYMMTGQGPDEWRDYFFPKDGTMNADGTPHRVSIPSYMKDFFAYERHPMQTLANKTAPTVNEVIEMLENKDFYGTQIFNPKDPIYQQGLDILKYEGQSFVPFSFKQDTSTAEQSLTQQIEQKFGIMAASKEFQRTPTQSKIVTEMAKDYSDEAKTKEAADRISARREVRERLFKGEDYDSLPQDLQKRAAYSDKTLKEVIKDATVDPYYRMFRDLKSEGQLDVWAGMSNKEKLEYTEFLNNTQSFVDLHDQKPEIFDKKTEAAYQEIIQLTHETRGRKKEGAGGLKVFSLGNK